MVQTTVEETVVKVIDNLSRYYGAAIRHILPPAVNRRQPTTR